MSEDHIDEFTWADLLTDLVARRDMDRGTAAAAMERVLSGELTPRQVTGFAVALRAKGETADEIVHAGLMVKEAGMKLSVTCIAGLGSLELSEEHAIKTAEALSRMKPEYIGLLTLLFELPTPLMRDWQEGRFYLMNPIEIAHETLILLEHIDSEGSIFRANHASNYVNLAGTLNRDRDAMCQRLRQALEGKVKFRSESFRAR